jgi:hypothetical protein
MSAKYGVEWMFCEKRQTGQRIVEILKERIYGNNEKGLDNAIS